MNFGELVKMEKVLIYGVENEKTATDIQEALFALGHYRKLTVGRFAGDSRTQIWGDICEKNEAENQINARTCLVAAAIFGEAS